MKGHFFKGVAEAPPDPILGVAAAYKADTHPKKVNLGVGAYRTEEGKPYVFPSVKEAEEEIINANMDKEYLPQDGFEPLKKATQLMLFGDVQAVQDGRICTLQSLSGTGALRVLAEFIGECMTTNKTVYVSDPTWGNHKTIFAKAGFTVKTYPYWDQENRKLRCQEWISTMKNAEAQSIIILHACAHNPTGMDPTKEEWKQITQVIKERNLIPLIDTAYQGYASGDLDEDGWLARHLLEEGFNFFVAQSFAKNFGLYGERIGAMHLVTSSAEEAKRCLSQLKVTVRAMYSNPPLHGARIVTKVLTSDKLRVQWQNELKDVAKRIHRVRAELREGLEKKGTPGTWDHITTQIGMFSYTGMTEDQCTRLVDHYHIYLLKNGRISLAGLNSQNLPYVIDAIDETVRSVKSAKL